MQPLSKRWNRGPKMPIRASMGLWVLHAHARRPKQVCPWLRVSKCVCWLLVNMSNVWQMKWTFNTIKFNQNTVSHTAMHGGVEWRLNNVMLTALLHPVWFGIIRFLFMYNKCVFPWISHFNRERKNIHIRSRCGRKFPEGSTSDAKLFLLAGTFTICGCDQIMGVPFLRTNRIKRTFINYDDFHWIIFVDKFGSCDFTPRCYIETTTKWFKTDRQLQAAHAISNFQASVDLNGGYDGKYPQKTKQQRSKWWTIINANSVRNHPSHEMFRTNMQIYTIPHEILTSNMNSERVYYMLVL